MLAVALSYFHVGGRTPIKLSMRCSIPIQIKGSRRTVGLVISAETVNARFDENEPELGVLVFTVALEMFPNGDSLLLISS